MQEVIKAPAPFSLSAVIRSHGWVQLAPFQRTQDGNAFTYVGQLASGRVVSWSISSPAQKVAIGNEVDIVIDLPDGLSPDDITEMRQRVRWMLGLDLDLSGFYAAARNEPKLAHVETGAHGRLLRSASLFEDVVKTILTTNTTWSGTKRMVSALVTGFGAPLPVDGAPNIRYAFPTPEALAAADADVLRNEVKLGYRAPYIAELAHAVAGGDLDLEALKDEELPTPELRKRLLAIKGVGSYAAANLLLLLGHYDYVPVDSWAVKLVGHEWHNGEAASPVQVEEAFADWGAWKGLAFWFWKWNYHEDEASSEL